MDTLFSHIDYNSDHGMELGLWPRFYLQIQSLAQLSGSNSFHTRATMYEKEVIPEIKNFYDLNNSIQNTIQDYLAGMGDGRYYYKTSQGTPVFETHHERKILNSIKDFFIRGKVLLNNFMNCEIIDEPHFKISNFIKIKNQKDFDERKKQYLTTSDKRYIQIITLIDNARNSFLNEFTEIRGEVEHRIFTLDKFRIETSNDRIVITEPFLKGLAISDKISFYYEYILNLIEKILVYYFGINGELHLNGFAQLEINPDYNYAAQHYKYTFALGGTSWSENAERCKYD